ncbi:MAG: hypothetical protein JWL73_250 [Actinomycetia bacterium]|nr:hypothetical protein [Actinomycetes bacterium]
METQTRPPAGVLGYRPELDGLRALAVTAVLLFHAGVSWAKGGYLGVDVFFVLSGFLITRILLEERVLTGRTAILRFYMRRVLRLFPALVVVAAACAIYAELALSSGQITQMWHDVFATATYHMNWVEALHQQPAFGLLDHAWSLSIEEQFYVLWPLVLIVAHRLWGIRGVAGIAIAGAVASAGLRVLLLHNGSPDIRVYYGLDTHSDGILIGCALAAWTMLWPGLVDALHGPFTRGLGALALFAVGIAASTVDIASKSLYRWGYLLFGLTTAVVVADLYARGLTSRVLRWAPLVAVGRISYGLYLWHWPVFIVLNGQRIHWSFLPLTLLRLSVSLVFAVLSFFLVEQPFLRLKPRLEPWLTRPSRADDLV